MGGVTLFQRWRAIHEPLYDDDRKPIRLVRVHVLHVADGVPCSLDGTRWGVLRTHERPRVWPMARQPETVIVREWIMDQGPDAPTRRETVGAGHDPEHVFITEDVYDMLGREGA